MTEPEILTDIVDSVARITFNRPKARNALTPGMLTTMREFLKAIEHDPDVRCVLMTGAGEHFMAGGDVAGFDAALAAPPEARRRDFEERARIGIPIFTTLERLSKPVVARVRGAVAGASIGWVAASDFAIASDTALFAFAHIHLGASPDGGLTWHLPRAIGLRKAKELVLLGGRMSAAEAMAAGLVNSVVPDAEINIATAALVAKLVAAPPLAVGLSKRLLNQASARSQARQMEVEAEYFGLCAQSADFVEGIRAFGEKRKPAFSGR